VHKVLAKQGRDAHFTTRLWRVCDSGDIPRGNLGQTAREGGAPETALSTQQWIDLTSIRAAIAPFALPGDDGVEHRASCDNDRRFRDLLNALPAAVYTTDAAGRITFFNEAAAELWGHRPELGKSEWCGSWRLYCLDGTPMRHDECPMAVTLREGRQVLGEAIAERPDGTRVPFAAYPKPLRDEAGLLVGAVNTLIDITHRKAEDERRRLLINELNHRIKNTLATVQSIAAHTFRDHAGEALQSFEARLMALSNAHNLLTCENWEGAALHELLARTIAPLSGPDDGRFDISGPELRLTPQVAVALSMALHELCTNAAKYGALSGPAGRVTVRWSRTGAGHLLLRWTEQGGPPVQPPKQRGFGSRLIERGIARELGAEVRLHFARPGVICEIDAPLA
jgi:PAS domain S-box-containing protein